MKKSLVTFAIGLISISALALKPDVIAVGCPFCMTMMTDGVKNFNKEQEIKVLDVAELISSALDLVSQDSRVRVGLTRFTISSQVSL